MIVCVYGGTLKLYFHWKTFVHVKINSLSPTPLLKRILTYTYRTGEKKLGLVLIWLSHSQLDCFELTVIFVLRQCEYVICKLLYQGCYVLSLSFPPTVENLAINK